ncbi:uncharacterized protein LOC118411283 [Branchiostoma floridae]|uniref:Uncharacterized protein LOC118411283 n=2 Tax=Branchiostoma floridae TaxID=7739 RepID=A0A9J7KRU9_BRAFL|nr:uncharacterized protein LOC118411283 [Branchiostoma floridae]
MARFCSKWLIWLILETCRAQHYYPYNSPTYNYDSDSRYCVDESRFCPSWAERGHCNINPGYMLKKCRLSCRQCSNPQQQQLQEQQRQHQQQQTKGPSYPYRRYTSYSQDNRLPPLSNPMPSYANQAVPYTSYSTNQHNQPGYPYPVSSYSQSGPGYPSQSGSSYPSQSGQSSPSSHRGSDYDTTHRVSSLIGRTGVTKLPVTSSASRRPSVDKSGGRDKLARLTNPRPLALTASQTSQGQGSRVNTYNRTWVEQVIGHQFESEEAFVEMTRFIRLRENVTMLWKFLEKMSSEEARLEYIQTRECNCVDRDLLPCPEEEQVIPKGECCPICEESGYTYGHCHMRPNFLEDQVGINGHIDIRQKLTGGNIEVLVDLVGFDARDPVHGFHIHADGDLSMGCDTAGPIYDPFNKSHGGLNTTERKVGDLGNLDCDELGRVMMLLEVEDASLLGPYSILGRSMVIHANEDDFGHGGHEMSPVDGNSGVRLACCVIGRTSDAELRWAAVTER